MKWPVLLVLAACGNDHGAGPDATAARDAPAITHDSGGIDPVTCTACMQLHTTGTALVDVAADGTTIYVRSIDGTISSVATDGSLTTVASSTTGMTGMPGGVAYVIASSSMVQAHELVGSTDRLLGSVAGSILSAKRFVAGTATDVYVLGAEGSLWRFARATTNTAPVVVATASPGAGLVVGTTAGAWQDGSVETTAIPGPSTPLSYEGTSVELAYLGDTLYAYTADLVTSHTTLYRIASIPPGTSVFEVAVTNYSEYISVDELTGSSGHVFYRQRSQPAHPFGELVMATAGANHGELVILSTSWFSDVLAVTPANVYGLEGSTVDVLAR